MKASYLAPLALAALLSLPSCNSVADSMRNAMDDGDTATLQALIQGEDASWKTDTVPCEGGKLTLLEYACKAGSAAYAEMVLKDSPKPEDSQLAWYYVASDNFVDVARVLLAHGVMPGEKILVMAHSAEMADLLMDHGYSPLAAWDEPNGECPLYLNEHEGAFRAMVKRVGWKKIPAEAQQKILKIAVFPDDRVHRLRFLLREGLKPGMKIEGKALFDHASVMISSEQMAERQMSPRCAELLRRMTR